MTRNYTEEAYNQIKQTIEQIDSTDVSPVKDFISDLFLRLMQYLEVYSVEQYQNDMQAWYKIVLDSHNSTMSTVDQIFNDVDTVDFEYRDIMDGALDSIVSFQNTLNCLRDVISGKTSFADGKAAADGHLAAGKDSLRTACDTILTKMENQVLKESGLELVGDVLKLGAGFVRFLTSPTPLNCKKFADTLTATFGDLWAVSSSVLVSGIFAVGSLFGMDQKNYVDFRFSQLAQAEKYKDSNSISDFLGGITEDMNENLEECPKSNPYYPIVKKVADGSQIVSYASKGVDIVADGYEIVSDVKGSYDTIDELMHGKSYTVGEYVEKYELIDEQPYIYDIIDGENGPIYKVKISPGEIISKLLSDRTGIPLSGWDDPAKFDGNAWKTAGTIWSYTEKFLPDPVTGQTDTHELPDVAFGKFKDTKFVKDVWDFAKDTADFAKDTVDLTGDYLVRKGELIWQ